MGVSPREDCSEMGLSQKKVFISQPATTLGVQDSSLTLSLSRGELLSTKTTPWIEILQLIRTVSQNGTTGAKKQG